MQSRSENIINQDALKYIKSLKDSSVREVYSRHFIEHIDYSYLQKLLKELDRVLVKNGYITFIVPHYSNPYFYSDPTHKTSWGVHSFSYICHVSCLNRNVPKYISIKNWTLKKVSVRFVPMSNLKIFGIRIPSICSLLNFLINSNNLIIEFYERYLANFFSIYEIKFFIQKK